MENRVICLLSSEETHGSYVLDLEAYDTALLTPYAAIKKHPLTVDACERAFLLVVPAFVYAQAITPCAAQQAAEHNGDNFLHGLRNILEQDNQRNQYGAR